MLRSLLILLGIGIIFTNLTVEGVSAQSSQCRRPAQFLTSTYAENTTNFINYLLCLDRIQFERIEILERDLELGRQELAELRAAYQLLLEEVRK